MDAARDAEIVVSWRKNAEAWTRAVRDQEIESRRVATDAAILKAVRARAPRVVLDVGCGEGWLTRALAAEGARVTGVDAVPALVERARGAGGGDFRVMTYEDVAAGALGVAYDAAVCNFSLIGKDPVDRLVRAMPSVLASGGALFVQTVHPLMTTGDLPYVDGWREGSWAGFGAEFTDPAPWYFRTVETWVALIVSAGLRLEGLREPIHPVTGRPASILFTAVRT
jgi:2-polyprenyl-3-methyl-5-hydroxy-6-metoxy-1,4-benzoquinol methylase